MKITNTEKALRAQVAELQEECGKLEFQLQWFSGLMHKGLKYYENEVLAEHKKSVTAKNCTVTQNISKGGVEVNL